MKVCLAHSALVILETRDSTAPRSLVTQRTVSILAVFGVRTSPSSYRTSEKSIPEATCSIPSKSFDSDLFHSVQILRCHE